MTWTVPQRDLKRLIEDVKPDRPKKTDVAITGEGQLRLLTGDDTCRAEATLAIADGAAGSVIVPYAPFRSAVLAMSKELTLTRGEGSLVIASNGTTVEIPERSVPAPDPIPELEHVAILPAAELWRAVSAAKRCAAAEMSRPVLSGVHFVTRRGKLWCEATDGFMLGIVPVGPVEVPITATVPALPAPALGRFTGDVQIGVAGDYFVARDASRAWAARCIDGTFPNLVKIVKGQAKTQERTIVVVESARLLDAVQAVLQFTDDRRMVGLGIGDGLSIGTVKGEQGERPSLTMSLEAAVTGGPNEVRLNGEYVRTVVEGLAVDRVQLEVTSPREAVAFRAAGVRSGAVFVVMPMIVWEAGR